LTTLQYKVSALPAEAGDAYDALGPL